MSVPLIDWTNHSTIVKELETALTTTGFARIYNLWNQQQLEIVNQWFTAVQTWFLTTQNKSDYSAGSDAKEGWTPVESQLLSPKRKFDWKECFEIDTFTDLSHLPIELSHPLGLTYPLFLSKGKEILKIFEQILKTEPGLLVEAHADPDTHHLRTAFYPASNKRENQLPCSEHKDYNTITLLFSPDENKRLQVKNRENKWEDIKYLDNSVVINIGNLMQVWTQDYLISAPHRVLFNDKNSFTSAYFMTLSENYKLTPIGPNPRKYPDTFVKRFNSQFNRSKQIMRIKNSFNEK